MARLMDSPEKGSDLDSRILAAYISQCTAEAQESMLVMFLLFFDKFVYLSNIFVYPRME